MDWKAKIYQKIESLLPKLIEENQKNLQTIPEFISGFSNKVDKLIQDVEQSTNVNYSAGKVILTAINDTEMELSTDLYFKHMDSDDFLNKKTKLSAMQMDLFLIESEVKRLLQEKEISFPVEKP